MSSNKERIKALLKSIETGDPAGVEVVNEARYIQHNPQTHEGSEGLAVLFKRLARSSPRVNVVRIFEDGDFVFGHTEYDFDSRKIGFEIFRFEDGRAVEHWDNIQERAGPNQSGHSMVDGPTEAENQDLTEANRNLVREFVGSVLVKGKLERLGEFISRDQYTEHNPHLSNDVTVLKNALAARTGDGRTIEYQQIHRVLAEGNFVLCVTEGRYQGIHTSYFDLFRIQDGKVVEHWDTREKIAPEEDWKNNNGKF